MTRLVAIFWAVSLLFATTVAWADDPPEQAAEDGPTEGVDATLARWNDKDMGAEWVTLERAQTLFAGATSIDSLDGTPPAAPVRP